MNDTRKLEELGLLFIQALDREAYEAFTEGHLSAERYREIARHIGTIQGLTVNILYNDNKLVFKSTGEQYNTPKTLYS